MKANSYYKRQVLIKQPNELQGYFYIGYRYSDISPFSDEDEHFKIVYARQSQIGIPSGVSLNNIDSLEKEYIAQIKIHFKDIKAQLEKEAYRKRKD